MKDRNENDMLMGKWESYSTGTEKMPSRGIGFNYKSLNCKE